VPISMCRWKNSVDDVLQRHGTPSQAESSSTPETIQDQRSSGGPLEKYQCTRLPSTRLVSALTVRGGSSRKAPCPQLGHDLFHDAESQLNTTVRDLLRPQVRRSRFEEFHRIRVGVREYRAAIGGIHGPSTRRCPQWRPEKPFNGASLFANVDALDATRRVNFHAADVRSGSKCQLRKALACIPERAPSCGPVPPSRRLGAPRGAQNQTLHQIRVLAVNNRYSQSMTVASVPRS
jgi:hypothetical protein